MLPIATYILTLNVGCGHNYTDEHLKDQSEHAVNHSLSVFACRPLLVSGFLGRGLPPCQVFDML